MELAKVILENGLETEANGLFYIYNSNYYFLYTEKELAENGYVILKIVQVGKEVKSTENGSVETGYMIGIEPSDWDSTKKSITLIVDDKKNSKQSPEIRYLPINMLATLKITSNKTIKLMKNIVEQYFGIKIEEQVENKGFEDFVSKPEPAPEVSSQTVEPSVNTQSATSLDVPVPAPAVEVPAPVVADVQPSVDDSINAEDSDVIIDYRKSFFEEQEKNKELEAKVQELTDKLNRIKEIIE